jgi:hypothetical protein
VSAAPLDWMVSAAVPILHGVADIISPVFLGSASTPLAIISPKEGASKRLAGGSRPQRPQLPRMLVGHAIGSATSG